MLFWPYLKTTNHLNASVTSEQNTNMPEKRNENDKNETEYYLDLWHYFVIRIVRNEFVQKRILLHDFKQIYIIVKKSNCIVNYIYKSVVNCANIHDHIIMCLYIIIDIDSLTFALRPLV